MTSRNMALPELLEHISGKLIVSCQAGTGHALRDTPTMRRMAHAAVAGGASAIRCGGVGGVEDVAAVSATVDVPVIGLTKDGSTGVYITPTVASAQSIVDSGADVVAADATARPRPDGATFADTVRTVHEAGCLVMADVATFDEGVAAARTGADIVATTLAGNIGPDTPDGPDLDLVADLHAALGDVPIVAEGRYHTPDDAAAAIASGATSVVVGTAITDPTWITGRFARGLAE